MMEQILYFGLSLMDIFQGRQSIRLRHYDYSHPGYYFVTICTSQRCPLFGKAALGTIVLNDAGEMVLDTWIQIPVNYPGINTDAFIVMPNHIHGIIVLQEINKSSNAVLSLSEIVQRFKTLTTRRYIEGVKHSSFKPFINRLWQRNYYERVIRNDRELNALREYITLNPENWDKDEEFVI